ncbi:MAG: AIPR family protein [Cytophagaceae bacterium]|nr:AIPR family protein [Cytophagaceae bacterium]
MNVANDLALFHTNVQQEILERLESGEGAHSPEEVFTQYALDLLAEAGETENARECRGEKLNQAGQRIHKINGYALTGNGETVQLFHTIFRGGSAVQKVYKDDIEKAVNQSTRFLKNALNGYFEGMEPTALAFDLAREIKRISGDLVRAEVFILTDGECTLSDQPAERREGKIGLTFHLIDLRRLSQLERGEQEPIGIDFERDFGQSIPCLSVPTDNETYQAYLATIPGGVLSAVYEHYGARLMESNVRVFLQLKNKVNTGIRKTILEEPEMFLAYNNGIAATASEVQFTPDGRAIRSIRGLQIVNGGQTTATLFHTQKKDGADLSRVFVPMKLSVVREEEKFNEIVGNISRYANSQSKVSEADFTANSPFHTAIEKLSRVIWAPPQAGQNHQTRWFYERARGQYKIAESREGTEKAKTAFLKRNPKNQVIAKIDLAKYVVTWEARPYEVAEGAQFCHNHFIKDLPKNFKPDSVYFEDVVAKAILFRTAVKLYGTKANGIGDLRSLTVPYALAWLSKALGGRLDLYAIYKRQALSEALKNLLYELMVKVDQEMIASSDRSNYGEWAKKKACWEHLGKQRFLSDFSSIRAELLDLSWPSSRKVMTGSEADQIGLAMQAERMENVPADVWAKIETWGRTTNRFTSHQCDLLFNIRQALQNGRPFRESELKNGPVLLDRALSEAPQLFGESDEASTIPVGSVEIRMGDEVMMNLIRQMAAWEKEHRRLQAHHAMLLQHISEGKTPLNEIVKRQVDASLQTLKRYGFKPE